jgi:hypothetical protein
LREVVKMKIFADSIAHAPLNDIDNLKKEVIKKSLLDNGYMGEPIAYCANGLLTGSHRLAAAKEIDAEIEVIDLTEYVNMWCENNDASYTDIQFDVIDEMTITEIIKYFTEEE